MSREPLAVRVELELLRDGDAPEGRMRTAAGEERTFGGWLELIGALSHLARTGTLRDTTSTGTSPGSSPSRGERADAENRS